MINALNLLQKKFKKIQEKQQKLNLLQKNIIGKE